VPVVDITAFIGEDIPSEAGNAGNVKELDDLPAGIDTTFGKRGGHSHAHVGQG